MERNAITIEFPHFPSGESWDRDLSDDQWRSLSANAKHLRSYTSLLRKVALLQSWAKNPVELAATTTKIPLKRPSLRRWIDAEKGLWKWSDVAIDFPSGRNAKIMEAFQWAVDDIIDIRAQKQMGIHKTTARQAAIIHRLEIQNARLLEEIRNLSIKLYGKA